MCPTRTLGLILACGLAVAGAWAQDSVPQPARDPAVSSPEGAERARMREMIVRRREVADGIRERLDDAIARLDRGEPFDSSLADGRLFPAGDEAPDSARWQRGGRPEGGAPGAGMGGPPQPPSAEEVRRLRVFVDEHLPMLARRLREAERDDPQASPRMIGRIAPRLREALDSRERSPEVFRLRVQELEQGFQLLDAARRTRRVIESEGPGSPAAIDARARFRELAATHYDTQVALQREEVADLERRLTDLRAELDRKTNNRDAEIDERVDEVLLRSRPDRAPAPERGDREPGEPDRQRRGPQ